MTITSLNAVTYSVKRQRDCVVFLHAALIAKKIKKLKLAIANCKNMCYNNREVSDG